MSINSSFKYFASCGTDTQIEYVSSYFSYYSDEKQLARTLSCLEKSFLKQAINNCTLNLCAYLEPSALHSFKICIHVEFQLLCDPVCVPHGFAIFLTGPFGPWFEDNQLWFLSNFCLNFPTICNWVDDRRNEYLYQSSNQSFVKHGRCWETDKSVI